MSVKKIRVRVEKAEGGVRFRLVQRAKGTGWWPLTFLDHTGRDEYEAVKAALIAAGLPDRDPTARG